MEIQNKIDNILPFFRSFFYDDNMLSRFVVILPSTWNIREVAPYVLATEENVQNHAIVSRTITLGIQEGSDLPFDFFYDLIFNVIQLNEREEKKQKLLREKMIELENIFNNASLEEVESFNFGQEIVESKEETLVYEQVEEPTNLEKIETFIEPVPLIVNRVEPPTKLAGKIVPLDERDNDDEIQNNEFTPSYLTELEREIKK